MTHFQYFTACFIIPLKKNPPRVISFLLALAAMFGIKMPKARRAEVWGVVVSSCAASAISPGKCPATVRCCAGSPLEVIHKSESVEFYEVLN